MAASTDELLQIVLDVDWDKEPECEGLYHPHGTQGHDGGPAKWILRVPCGCGHLQLCDGRAQLHRESPYTRCAACDHIARASELIFIEL
jgi:hypothetical protein